ncbi:MAG TPA: secondary thiamine-phosphate synthase enzyme YjbQ [Candidatus Brocadiales bacterium]|nr:secondary thiamine-phosphate synthase enzyme YjbQ [Candidatus Brocadiales bacterium]
MQKIKLQTRSRTELLEITQQIENVVHGSDIREGICYVYVPHTTAGITINENADPSVRRDILNTLNKIIPFDGNYTHAEGNAAAHIKASLVGFSACIPICDGKLALGTWQGIFFCEFDGPRSREVFIQILKSES